MLATSQFNIIIFLTGSFIYIVYDENNKSSFYYNNCIEKGTLKCIVWLLGLKI